MKVVIGLIFMCLLFTVTKINAQKVNLKIVTAGYQGDVYIFDPAVNYNPQKFLSMLPLDKMGVVVYTVDLAKPRYIEVYFTLPGFMGYKYNIFLSPGDKLLFKIQFINKLVTTLSISGKGSKNNQPEIFALTNLDLLKFKEDKKPDNVFAAVKSHEASNKIILKQYIKKYKPSSEFIKYAQLNNEYFALSTYFEFYHGRYTPSIIVPNYKSWQNIEDSLMIKHKIDNDGAISSYNYSNLLQVFLMQEGPIRMYQEYTQPLTFYKNWYHTTVNRGRKIYTSESRNEFLERIINRYFNGKAAELVYAQFFRFHLRFKHYEGMDVVFAHFKHKYPKSKYIPVFSGAIAEIVAKQRQILNNKMVFVADNGTMLNTMKDVTRLMKGKTVFVDMWGTWCAPCRIELEKYTPQIRDHFKGKNVTFLYIANKDIGHQEEWKKVIAFYKIEGTHILANKNLDKNVMSELKSTGYPTHFIIKKDGSFVKTKTQDESDTQAIIKEIEAAL